MRLIMTTTGHALALVLIVASGSLPLAQLQTRVADDSAASLPPEGTTPSSRVLTGKERLGEKWKDEQRVDNCNVPIDKRGTRPRPDTCANVPTK
jgi:hypothetical protein